MLSSVPGGPTCAIARNQISNGTSNGAPTYSEFTGPTFSPDGKVLFVNIQVPGLTLAITGPREMTTATPCGQAPAVQEGGPFSISTRPLAAGTCFAYASG